MKQELSLSDIPFPETSAIERQVLADCVGNPESMPDFTGIVEEEMFTNANRKYLWQMIIWLFNNGQAIDLATMAARTGRVYIEEIINHHVDPSTPFTAIQHAQQLRAASIRRRAYFSAVRLIESTIRPTTNELDVYASAQNLMLEIQGETPIVAEAPIGDVMDEVDKEVKENRSNTDSGKRSRIPTGFHTLDALTYNGWRPGQLIILAARPSIGKTAIMLQMAKEAARNGFPATVFSLEMSKAELGQRLLFSTGRVRPYELTTGYVDENGYGPAMEEIRSLSLFINDESRTLAGILSRLTASVAQGRCKVAFIDYLGLLKIDESGRTPLNQQIAQATRELKLAAKRLKVPIVLLCQLNRESVKDDVSPQLHHLKDSGSIEQDADIVLMLEQEKRITENSTERPNIKIWVRKNRQFQRDLCIKVEPNESYSSFRELSDTAQPEQETQEDF